ncbi:hypothetical protein BDV96DRAFT_616222 [Lophiotrema nucula]|uniref:Uncharacterized protein n=1 Tax=Lophiotrema nucula TaxID=690887 RepID=A0A6A5YQI9_9PLEO|nr:hypothetical protein BDV96DRAFT_616222 [Lophiotrema nucula]
MANSSNPDLGQETVEPDLWGTTDADGTFRYSGAPFPSPEEIREQTLKFNKSLFENVATLQAIIERYEEVIQKRWLKKKKAQRAAILLTSWPNMAAKHRPDFVALFSKEVEKINTGIRVDAFYWPQINLEDLTKPNPLLIFLNARARHLPHVFAHPDIESAPIGRADPSYLWSVMEEHVMVFKTDSTPQTYGQLLVCPSPTLAESLCHDGFAMHPGHGLQMLEIQDRIWDFLVRCCKLIMHDMSLEAMINPGIPSQPEPPRLTENNQDRSSLDITSLEKPYRVPGRTDFSRLRALGSAARHEAEDHIWALREDPAYFKDIVLSYKTHRFELMSDSNGNCHPYLKRASMDNFYNFPLRNMVTDAYVAFSIWDNIHSLLGLAGKRPPEPFMKTFRKLLFRLEMATEDFTHNLKFGFPMIPELRRFFVRRVPESTSQPHRMHIDHTALLVHEDSVEARFVRCVDMLWNEDLLDRLGLPCIMDAIERAMQTDAKIKKLVTPWVATLLYQLSVVAECYRQLHLYPHWARHIEASTQFIHKEELTLEYAASNLKWHNILRHQFEAAPFARLVDSSGVRFAYPVDKRRTQENVEKLRRAEANLDQFWAAVDARFKKTSSVSQHDLVEHLLTKERILQRTPPWTAPTKPTQVSHTLANQDYNYEYLSPTLHDSTKDITGNFNKLSVASKQKTKTHGIADPTIGSSEILQQPVSIEEQQIFRVDKRTYKVFKTIFHSPNSPDQPGEIPWIDFLYAMSCTGFSAEKLHGSAWHFTPCKTKLSGCDRSIIFHEPHPSSKLPFTKARMYGRRLTKNYGWNGEMFRLA